MMNLLLEIFLGVGVPLGLVLWMACQWLRWRWMKRTHPESLCIHCGVREATVTSCFAAGKLCRGCYEELERNP